MSVDVHKFNARLYERAKQRGLVSQTEQLYRAEVAMEEALVKWEWNDGFRVGGPWHYVPKWMQSDVWPW